MSTTVQPDPSWYEVDPEFYKHGGTCFSDAEMLALAELDGAQILVSPANGGEEAVSIANLGASVTVFDAESALARARALSQARYPGGLDWLRGVAGLVSR